MTEIRVSKKLAITREEYYNRWGIFNKEHHFMGMMKNTPIAVYIKGSVFILDDIINNEHNSMKHKVLMDFNRATKDGSLDVPFIHWSVI